MMTKLTYTINDSTAELLFTMYGKGIENDTAVEWMRENRS